MNLIDTHIHLGNIYGFKENIPLEEREARTTHPCKPNTYEVMRFRNIYLGRLNYLFRSLIAGSARVTTKYGNVPNLLDSMSRSKVSKSIVLPIAPYVDSDLVLKVCARNPQLIPFCSVHPRDREKRRKLERYVKAGAKGLKLHPVIQEFHPADPAVMELIEEVKLYDIPVVVHWGGGRWGGGITGC